MKRAYTLAAMAALVFTACEKNESVQTDANNAVQFVINQTVTRVTTVNNVTSFEVNDEIAITSSNLKADITNEKYKYTGSGLTGKSVSFTAEDVATFVAHYPSTLTNNGGTIEMTVPSEQTADNFHDNMFMVSTASGSADNPVVTFQFKHQLSWVKVVLNEINGASVVLNNIKPTAVWTPTSLSATGTEVEILTWKQDEEQTYWALVPAQTITSGSKLVTLTTIDDKVYEYTLTEDLILSTAKVKTITLSVEDDSVNASFSANESPDVDWADDTELEGEVTEKPYEPLVLISGTFSDDTKISTGMINYSNLADGWILGSLASGDISDCELALSVTNIKNTRFNRGIAYKTGPIPANVKKLTLTFDARYEGADESDITNNIYATVVQPEASNIAFMTGATPEVNGTVKTYTYEIDLTTATVSQNDQTNGIEANYTGGVVLHIAPGNANVGTDTIYENDGTTVKTPKYDLTNKKWYISNVSLVEKVETLE